MIRIITDGFILDTSSLSYAGQVFELPSSVGTGHVFISLRRTSFGFWTFRFIRVREQPVTHILFSM